MQEACGLILTFPFFLLNKKIMVRSVYERFKNLYYSIRSITLKYSLELLTAQIIGVGNHFWKIFPSKHLTRGLFPNNNNKIFVKQSFNTTNILALIVSV